MADRSREFKLIKAGRLIDSRGGPPIESGAVLVQGSKISDVGRAGDITPPEGARAEVYDYPGQTIMPGMVDCHTHHNGFGDGRVGEDVAAQPALVLRHHQSQPALFGHLGVAFVGVLALAVAAADVVEAHFLVDEAGDGFFPEDLFGAEEIHRGGISLVGIGPLMIAEIQAFFRKTP